MSSGNVIKASAVGALALETPAQGRAARPQEPAAACHTDEAPPEIKLHQEGDRVVAIEVVCGCGKTTFIECVYEDGENS